MKCTYAYKCMKQIPKRVYSFIHEGFSLGNIESIPLVRSDMDTSGKRKREEGKGGRQDLSGTNGKGLGKGRW